MMSAEMLNPIQQKIAQGMSGIAAFLSEQTCGEACWEAREDVCRCSCRGKNHGCMRGGRGERPERTAKIDGVRYVLKGIGYEGLYESARELNKLHCNQKPSYGGLALGEYHDAATSRDGCFRMMAAKIRPASKDQVARWPELAAYRENLLEVWRVANPNGCYRDYPGLPDLLWIREDIANAS